MKNTLNGSTRENNHKKYVLEIFTISLFFKQYWSFWQDGAAAWKFSASLILEMQQDLHQTILHT